MNPSAQARAAQVAFMFFDVDGVLTDGGLYYDAQGESLKRFCVLDGQGFKSLLARGIGVGILSGRRHPAVSRRAQELGVDTVFLGIEDKRRCLEDWIGATPWAAHQIGHMGDDLADMAVFEWAGFAASVPNAPASVRAAAHWVSDRSGGWGAAREACEFLLKARA
jgi:3-deoxy-D-manno-octulosonate 8-phosphate phosphatase (KDO 8-P phosphatase)